MSTIIETNPRTTIRYTSTDDEGSGFTWALYPSDVDEDVIAQDFDFGSSYGGPGRAFSHGCEIRRTSTRCLVKQYHALDI